MDLRRHIDIDIKVLCMKTIIMEKLLPQHYTSESQSTFDCQFEIYGLYTGVMGVHNTWGPEVEVFVKKNLHVTP